jgi:hypothetical protein
MPREPNCDVIRRFPAGLVAIEHDRDRRRDRRPSACDTAAGRRAVPSSAEECSLFVLPWKRR